LVEKAVHFELVKRLTAKLVSEVTYDVSGGMLNCTPLNSFS